MKNKNGSFNCIKEKAFLIGSLMRKINKIALLYYLQSEMDYYEAKAKSIVSDGFIDMSSQSLVIGLTMIESRLLRFSTSIKSMAIKATVWPEGEKKSRAYSLRSLLSEVEKSIDELKRDKLPTYMTDDISCMVGIGFYSQD